MILLALTATWLVWMLGAAGRMHPNGTRWVPVPVQIAADHRADRRSRSCATSPACPVSAAEAQSTIAESSTNTGGTQPAASVDRWLSQCGDREQRESIRRPSTRTGPTGCRRSAPRAPPPRSPPSRRSTRSGVRLGSSRMIALSVAPGTCRPRRACRRAGAEATGRRPAGRARWRRRPRHRRSDCRA